MGEAKGFFVVLSGCLLLCSCATTRLDATKIGEVNDDKGIERKESTSPKMYIKKADKLLDNEDLLKVTTDEDNTRKAQINVTPLTSFRDKDLDSAGEGNRFSN